MNLAIGNIFLKPNEKKIQKKIQKKAVSKFEKQKLGSFKLKL